MDTSMCSTPCLWNLNGCALSALQDTFAPVT